MSLDKDALEKAQEAFVIRLAQRGAVPSEAVAAAIRGYISALPKEGLAGRLAVEEINLRSIARREMKEGHVELGRVIDDVCLLLSECATVLQGLEGWRLVPVEPTAEMKRAALKPLAGIEPQHGYTSANQKRIQRAYHEMLAAAPTTGGRDGQ